MKKTKRILAFLIVAALTVTRLPMMAFATSAGEDRMGIEATENGEVFREIPSLQSMPATAGTSMGMWALEKLAGGVVSGVAGKGVNEAFAAIFGSDTAQILKALQEIKGKLDNIENQIKGLYGKFDEKELTGNLDSFAEFFSDYSTPYDRLLDFQTNLAYNAELTDLFMQDLYRGTNRNIDTDSKTVIAAANALGDKITMVLTGGYNVFGAFDKLELHQNLWEHQGYDMRNKYRNYIIDVYTLYNAMGQIACNTMIEAHKGDNLSDKNILLQAMGDLKGLKDNAKKVNAMNKRCAVIEHTDLRIFRDTVDGKDLYAFYPRVDVAQMRDPYPGEDITTNEYIKCMTTTPHILSRKQRSSAILWTTLVKSAQVSIEDLQKLYSSYSGEKTLYDILFDKDEGNFVNVGSLPKDNTMFTTNIYEYYKSVGKWNYVPVDSDGKDHRKWIGTSNRDKHFSVVKYHGLIKQGAVQSSPSLPDDKAIIISGMANSYELPYTGNITLAVEEKTGASYQWFVDETGIGEQYEEIPGATTKTYTLPILIPSMNGNKYSCAVIQDQEIEGEVYTLGTFADIVTLVLTGEGVPEPVTEHEVGSAQDLEAALDKVADGSWNSHTLKLTAEIKYQKPITLHGSSVTIDLNGYHLGVMPSNTAEPNINPMSNHAEIAAVNVHFGSLRLTGDGELNVFAPEGVAYGVYAGELAEVTVHNAISNNGGTAVYTADGGIMEIKVNAGAEGKDSHAVQCFDGGSVIVGGNVTATGELAFGVYADASSDLDTAVTVNGDIIVSGNNSRGASVNGKKMFLEVGGSVTVTGNGASGISASGGNYDDTYMAWIAGDVTAPDVAVNASAGAGVRVSGNVTSSDEGASAIYAFGGSVTVDGNVFANGINGTAISASKWDLIDPAAGGFVMVDGQITAYTPLRIESLPVGENEHTGETAVFGHYIYTDGTNTVWANEESFVSTNPNAQAPSIITHPQDETVEPGGSVTLTVSTKVSDGGTLSYQWYSNTTDDFSSGTPINGATGTSYTPPTDTLGTRYYYVIITNTNETAQGEKTTQVISRLADVTTTYTVTFDKNGGDTQSSPIAKEVTSDGNVYTLPTAPARSGYNFKGWNTQADGNGTAFTATTVVTNSMTVYAQWSKKSSGGSSITYYTVAFDTNGGSNVPGQRLSRNSKVTKPSDPSKGGFAFDGWFTDSGLTQTYDFNKTVTSGFTLYAAWEKSDTQAPEEPLKPDIEWNNPFTDVNKSDWFYTAVEYVHTNKLFSGTADNAFSPGLSMTRGMLVTVLHRLAGNPKANKSTGFSDVSGDDAYYHTSVSWAVENGIINGVGGNAFAPDGEVTREQVAAILWRYTKFSGIDVSVGENTNILSYNDSFNISEYAISAMQWACGKGLITGKPSGALDPQGGATRAEVAAMLQRFSGIIE